MFTATNAKNWVASNTLYSFFVTNYFFQKQHFIYFKDHDNSFANTRNPEKVSYTAQHSICHLHSNVLFLSLCAFIDCF